MGKRSYHCFLRHQRRYLVMACRNTTRTQLIQCYSLVLRSWNEVEWHLCEKLTTKSIKIEGKFTHGKVKMRKKHIKTNFHGQDIPYDMY